MVAAVKSRGGRAWAYLQAQGSEFYNLAGDALECGVPVEDSGAFTWASAAGKLNSQTVSTNLSGPGSVSLPDQWKPSWQIFKIKETLANGTPTWACQGKAPGRVIPTYFLNGPLAAYQCSAWAEPVRALGFTGIHWDTMIAPPAGSAGDAWRAGAKAFVMTAADRLKAQNLLQTFNDLSLSFAITTDASYFSQGEKLAFPYSEVWSQAEEAAFYEAIVPGAGAVIAHYPGTPQNGCCSTSARTFCPQPLRACAGVCTCEICEGESYDNCPANGYNEYWSQEDLIAARYDKALCKGARYLIVGNGKERLVTEYFPDTLPLSSGNYDLIKGDPYGQQPALVCKRP
jgi:hypothetical protein